ATTCRIACGDSRPTVSEWLERRDRNDEPQQLRCRGPIAVRLAAYARRPAPAGRRGGCRAARLVPNHGNFPGWRDRGAGGRRVAPRKLLLHDRISRHRGLFRSPEAFVDRARFSGSAGTPGAVERPSINVATERS